MTRIYLFCLCLFVQLNAVAQSTLSNGLQAQYLFNTNAQDNSGNGNDAEAKGISYVADRNKKENSAANFNGFNSYLTLPAKVQVSNAYTVSAWVNIRKHKYLARLFELGNGSNDFNVVVALSNNNSGKVLVQTYKGKGFEKSELLSPEPLPTNEWVHLAVTQSGSSVKIYKNGKVWAEKSDFAPIPSTTRSKGFVGKSVFSTVEGHEYPDGVIDDVLIYNRALSASEIEALNKNDSKPIVVRQPDVLTPQNVQAVLDETGSINILYDLDGEANIDAEIKVYTSLDNYTTPLKKMSGHFGYGMRAGLQRKIVWYDAPAQSLTGNNVTFKLEAHRPLKPVKMAMSEPLRIPNYTKTAKDLEKEKENQQVIRSKEDSISQQMTATFQALAEENKLAREVKPKVKATIQETTPLDSRPRYNLSVEYSYDIDSNIDGTKAEIINYPSGEYSLEKSQAASATALALKRTVERYLEDYLEQKGTVKVRIFGFTDAVNISRVIPYNGIKIQEADYFLNGSQEQVSVLSNSGITTNSQLAYLRTSGIRKYVEDNIDLLSKAKTTYEHHGITLDKDVGGIYRKIIIEVIIYDAFRNK